MLICNILQGDFVRKLKDAGTNDVEVKSAVEELLRRKQALLDSERGSSQDVSDIMIHIIFTH